MHERENALKEWLKEIIPSTDFILNPLAGDASFRRYFRVQYNGLSQIVMDAPPEKEALGPFIHITNVLTQANVRTPTIIAQNIEQGFLLLNDLGDVLLLTELQNDTVDFYYKKAIDTLLQFQKCSITESYSSSFNKEFMLKEMNLCSEWFFDKYLSLELHEEEYSLVQKAIHWIADELVTQPLVFIHRDYHSRNIMLLQEEQNPLAVIDFQDAMLGPITYDLVSLLKDCYISWPREQVVNWVYYFYEHSAQAQQLSQQDFLRAFDLCGLQRHLKVLGVFCRLYLRDGKARYLADLPLTLKYVLECSESYEELHPLFNFLQHRVRLS
jgi:N-acetylmuramate 1-kinase